MSREVSDDNPDSLGMLAELLNGSDLSVTQQRAVHDAVLGNMAAGTTVSGEEPRTRYRLTAAIPPRRRFRQLPDLVIPDNFNHPLPDLETPAQEDNSAT